MSLITEAALKLEYERVAARQAVPLTVAEREAIHRLASDIPALWHAATTTAAERQAVVRQLIEQVVISLEGTSERIAVDAHWAGGHHTALTVIRPVARLEQLSYYPELVRRVAQLRNDGQTVSAIAQILTEEGWRPAQGGDTFTDSSVRRLLARRDAHRLVERTRITEGIPKAANEWTTDEIVDALDMPRVTLYGWIKKGLVKAHRMQYQKRSMWLIWADETELNRLHALRAHSRSGAMRREPEEPYEPTPDKS